MTLRSIRPDRPVDPITIDILRAVAKAARAEGIDYMLVGATARDILLYHVLGLASPRATRDVDFAVAVKGWGQFDAVKARLVASGQFKDEERALQRLYYKARDFDFPLDLVPFGDIGGERNEVAWPPDMKIIMNVAGYNDVLAAAVNVVLMPGLEGKVVSLPGLGVLKLIAWSDRGKANPKDARDLIHLMENYTAAGNIDRVYDEEGVIEAGGYDPDLAGVYLLGKDIGRLVAPETVALLRQIIMQDFMRLAGEMIKPVRHRDNVELYVQTRLRLLLDALT